MTFSQDGLVILEALVKGKVDFLDSLSLYDLFGPNTKK